MSIHIAKLSGFWPSITNRQIGPNILIKIHNHMAKIYPLGIRMLKCARHYISNNARAITKQIILR